MDFKKNIVLRAPVFSLSGYGAHSRDIAEALIDDNNNNVSIIPTGWGGSSTADPGLSEKLIQKLIFGINNKITDMANAIFIHVGLPTEFEVKGSYNIGITAGLEANRISQRWVDGCNNMDMIIVPTSFVKDSFIREGVTKPVLVVNEGVDNTVFNLESSDTDLVNWDSIQTTTNFISLGQWSNVNAGRDRKQFTLLIDTFMKAFEGDASVGLILKTYFNNFSTPDRYVTAKTLSQLLGSRTMPKIYLIHGELTNKELASLYKSNKVKAYVSMTSGEGWNRPAAEAMACGLPVVITGWSGHMEYLNSNNAALIKYTLQDIPNEVIYSGDWFEKGMKWAMPDVDDAIAKMREVKNNNLVYRNNALHNSADFLVKYSKNVTYKVLTDAISNIVLKDNGSLNNATNIIKV
jgi:glycosyltransferase involved in cell wall biosynthesis